MPKLTKTLTDAVARAIETPPAEASKTTQVFHWCFTTPGFGLRVSSTGDKAWVFNRMVEKKSYKRTLGAANGAGSITCDTARKLFAARNNELHLGVDRLVVQREQAKADKIAAVTFGEALRDYVANKVREKDGLKLKSRTKSDYLGMIETGGKSKSGKPLLNGHLQPLESKGLVDITADDMRRVYADASKRGKTQADYAIRVLRAVLNWHGVFIAESPLAKTTAGKKRIVLASKAGKPSPIPAEQLGAWWLCASNEAKNARLAVSRNTSEGLRLMLLTGLRPGEVFGSADQAGMHVKDINFKSGCFTSFDTKNRSDFTVVMSKQVAEILKASCANKLPAAKVFQVRDAGKTLDAINRRAGVVDITPHKLRHTFTSIAEELVSGYALKHMVNHTQVGDTTGNNYIAKSDNQLRKSWQTVADFIEETAAAATMPEQVAA